MQRLLGIRTIGIKNPFFTLQRGSKKKKIIDLSNISAVVVVSISQKVQANSSSRHKKVKKLEKTAPQKLISKYLKTMLKHHI
jgi:hypothetical protein